MVLNFLYHGCRYTLAAWIVTFIVLCCFYSMSFKWGFLDHPGGRKKHQNAVPVIGGLGIFIGSSAILWTVVPGTLAYVVFWGVCCLLMVLSILDDLYSLRPSSRFVTQALLMGVLMIGGQTQIDHVGNLLGLGEVYLGPLCFIFTAFSLIGMTNAVNMLDGMDGLTGCISLVVSASLLFLAVLLGAHTEAMILLVLMGSLVAFLLFNFPCAWSAPYKIFLGDSGSTLLGLSLAWLCVRLTQSTVHANGSPVLMLWVMALPLMDTLHVMINRKLRGVSLFQADRRHIHHILLQLNGSPLETVLILTVFSMAVSVTGISLWYYGAPDYVLFWGILLLFGVYNLLAYRLKKRITQRRAKWSWWRLTAREV